jgi:hypothetical protein
MSIQLMVNALRLGNTGEEILNILDAITSEDNNETETETLSF